jgi:hypothetical protein
VEMRIKLIKPYQLLEVGAVIDCVEGIAVELVRRGLAEALDDKNIKIETKIESQSIDIVKKKRGRPRKYN